MEGDRSRVIDGSHNLATLITALTPPRAADLEARIRWQAAASETWAEQVLLCLADLIALVRAQLGRSPQTHGETEHTE